MAAQRSEKTRTPGIYRIHARGCPGGSCRCSRYQAAVYSARDGKLVRKHFESEREAKLWQAEIRGAVERREVVVQSKQTVNEAADELVAGMKDGSILSRKREPYKPAAVRSYERALTLRVRPAFGHRKLADLRMAEVEDFAAKLHREGLSASTIRNTLDPLRVIYRRARRRGEVTVDPTVGLELAGSRRREVNPPTTDEVRALLGALPASERALWATAFFAGLRRGELRALRWDDVNLGANPATIRVQRTWDDQEGEVRAKTEAGVRTVPLTAELARYLADHGLQTGRTADALVFGESATQPFTPTTVRRRAMKAWQAANERARERAETEGREVDADEILRVFTPHEARHSTASHAIEAGLTGLELASLIGHSDPRTTESIYGHLMAHSGAAVAAKLDAYHGEG